MRSYLQICKDVARECGLANGESAVITVASPTGQVARIVNYVRQAWIEVQLLHQHSGINWRWMRRPFTITTVADQRAYAFSDAVDDINAASIAYFRNWAIKSDEDWPKIYLASAGVGTEGWLTYVSWDDFKYRYAIGTQNSTFPAHITIDPQNNLVLGPTPNDVYTVTGDYMKGVQIFSDDADIPDWGASLEGLEDVIMYKAITKYGLQTNAVELVTIGEEGYATYLGMLEGDQLAEIPMGTPLA